MRRIPAVAEIGSVNSQQSIACLLACLLAYIEHGVEEHFHPRFEIRRGEECDESGYNH